MLLFGQKSTDDVVESVSVPALTDASGIDLSAGVESAVDAFIKEHHVPGAAVVIVKDGKTVFKRGFGQANVELKTTVDPDKTLFRIGSISKALTHLTLTRQVDRGRLKMDDDVAKYFDGIKNPHGFERPVKVENLLTHTTGFDQIGGSDRHIYNFDQPLEVRKSSRLGIADYLKTDRLRRVTPAGENFRYDTYGSTLAGAVIERVTGVSYAEAMQTEMFEPLGMSRSFVEADAVHFPDLATGYGYVDGNYVPQPYEVYVTTPASSIDATPADMGRLLEALTGGGANSHGRLFTAETAHAVLSPQFRPHPEFPGMTHGLFESYSSDSEQFDHHVRQIWHGGSMRGFYAALVVVPDYNLGVFVIVNRAPESGGGNVPIGNIVDRVIANLPDLPKRKPVAIPTRDKRRDLSEYVGDYYYGVFCHECSEADRAAGAWQRGSSRAVTQKDGALIVSGDEYLPRGNDVFVRNDGLKMVYFGRNKNGKVSFYVFSSSPDTFEKTFD